MPNTLQLFTCNKQITCKYKHNIVTRVFSYDHTLYFLEEKAVFITYVIADLVGIAVLLP